MHLYRLGWRPDDIDLVLLSHAHSDHIGGIDLLLLGAVVEHGGRLRERPLAVAGPPGIRARVAELVGSSRRLPGPGDPRLRWFEQEGGSSFAWRETRVDCVAVEHAPDLPALGYRVRTGGRTLAYSGDARLTSAIDDLARGADLLIVECGGARERGHLDWDDVRELRGRLPAATRLLVTHYDHTAAPGRSSLPGIELAEDLARYEL